MAKNPRGDDTPDRDEVADCDASRDESPADTGWLLDEGEAIDPTGITTHEGATHLTPSDPSGGFDIRKAMRLCEKGEIVWYQAEEHEVAEVYPDYCGGHSYGLVSLRTGARTVTNINVQGWGCRTLEEWSVRCPFDYEQLYPRPRSCPDRGTLTFLKQILLRIKRLTSRRARRSDLVRRYAE